MPIVGDADGVAGANLSGMLAFSTTFSGDMSGAKVTGTRFDGSTFPAGTTCPNGKVLTQNGGPNACGL